MDFSIITPTFNSAGTLDRLYESIRRQALKDKEWIIVDDGSSDNTAEKAGIYSADADFSVEYHRQERGHKKTAVNRGVELARGQWVLVADSDDELADEALTTLRSYWMELPAGLKEKLSGISGLCIDERGQLVGDRFPRDRMVSSDLELRLRHGVRGEKWGFKRREVMERFPYPEDVPGYVPESVVWSRIDRCYSTLYVNEVVRIYHMGRQLVKQKRRGVEARNKCMGRKYAAREALNEDFGWFARAPKELLKVGVNYVRYSMHCGDRYAGIVKQLDGMRQRVLVSCVFVLGWSAFLRDKYQCAAQERERSVEASADT